MNWKENQKLIGICFADETRQHVDKLVRRLLHGTLDNHPKPKIFTLNRGQLFPEKMLVTDYRFDGSDNWWPWLKSDDFAIPAGSSLSNIMIPTKETSMALYWLNECTSAGIAAILMGTQSTGKTKIVRHFLDNLSAERYLHNIVNLTANMRTARLQEAIMVKLDRRRKGVFGPPVGKSVNALIASEGDRKF